MLGDTSIFALLPKNNIKIPYDIKAFTKKRSLVQQNPQEPGSLYDIYSESSILSHAIQESRVIQDFFTFEGRKLIDSLIYSDQSETRIESTKEYQAFQSKNRKTLQVKWSRRDKNCQEDMRRILEGFLCILDIMSEVKLSDKSKGSYMQSRIEYGIKLSEKTASEKQEVNKFHVDHSHLFHLFTFKY